MAEYSIPDARLHRVIPSMFNAGDFPMPWIDNPTLDERRQYIRAYLKWRLPHDDMEMQERELRDLAERKAAMRLINGNLIEIGVDRFEWLVDKMFWRTWLGHLGKAPPFPWPLPKRTDELTEISQSFGRWLDIYRKEGDLVEAWPGSGNGAPDAEQRHLSDNETTATTQDLTMTERIDETDQLQKLSEQVDQLRQELQQRDEQIARMDKRIQQQKRQISQRDTKISDKDRRNRYLRDLLKLERERVDLLRQRNEDLHLENQETRRLNLDVLEAWRRQLN
ncbi:hypothetical protein CDV31_012875 [Fusarium ambrosium]|uniref:Uncharacterized protein n=1 Tax=Fusarium ambrosium TaxID=131363 RepID=A0A428T6Z3_9HYPO|nr:hypothetical protein CDV31_012875 [Fusarium ambrosium]